MTNLLQVLGLCLTASCGSLSQPVRSTTRSHDVDYDTYQVTYRYETNEVNSYEDLIEYNIYHFEGSMLGQDAQNAQINFSFFIVNDVGNSYISGSFLDDSYIDDGYFTAQQSYIIEDSNIRQQWTMAWADIVYHSINLDCDIVVYDLNSVQALLDYFTITPCENIPIESVSPIQHNNSIFGLVYDFIYNTILDIPNIENYSFNVFGVNTSLKQYLTISICVVLAILLIALLLWFLRWVFRTFSGLLS